jgi:hypothetical protein
MERFLLHAVFPASDRASRKHMTRIVASLFLATVAVIAVQAQYDPKLLYQRRGERDEGVRTVAVGGQDIELVSARIDGPKLPGTSPSVPAPAWSDSVKARFYLPESGGAYLAVRQLRSQSTYYWLSLPAKDDESLAGGWRAMATNEYAWPTSTVLANLKDVTLDDLGAVVRLGQAGDSNIQRVLPVALYTHDSIDSVDAYRFTWRPLIRVNVTADVYARGGDSRPSLLNRPAKWEDAGSPFTILWKPGNAPEGWYRLVLAGYFQNNRKLDREVVFYHHRTLSNAITRVAG